MTEDELTTEVGVGLDAFRALTAFISLSIDRDTETKRVIGCMEHLIKQIQEDRQRLSSMHAQDTKDKASMRADLMSVLRAVKPFVDAKDQGGLMKVTNGTFWHIEALYASLLAKYNQTEGNELGNQKQNG